MSNTNTNAAAASLAIVEAVGFEPCTGDLTPFWEQSDFRTCECYRCQDLVWQGRELPLGGECLAEREHNEIIWDRELRWELAAEIDADGRYYDFKRQCWTEEDERWEAAKEAEAKEELVERFLRAA